MTLSLNTNRKSYAKSSSIDGSHWVTLRVKGNVTQMLRAYRISHSGTELGHTLPLNIDRQSLNGSQTFHSIWPWLTPNSQVKDHSYYKPLYLRKGVELDHVTTDHYYEVIHGESNSTVRSHWECQSNVKHKVGHRYSRYLLFHTMVKVNESIYVCSVSNLETAVAFLLFQWYFFTCFFFFCVCDTLFAGDTKMCRDGVLYTVMPGCMIRQREIDLFKLY